MSEETQETNDGTWSGLKKTLIGTISTAILAGGGWLTTTLFNGGEKEEPKTEQVQQAQPAINISVDNSSKNSAGGTNTIIKEKTTVVEKQAPAKEEKPAKKSETEDSPW